VSEKKKKIPISLRIDEGVLSWFRQRHPKGYQTLIHLVLEQYVMEQTRKSARIEGRAQELFRRYHAQCFWHMDPHLVIDSSNLNLVIAGLGKYGGRNGLLLAEELCQ